MMLKSIIFVSYALVFSVFLSHRAMADFEGIINIDEDSANNSETSKNNKPVDSSDGSGDDENDYGSVMTDEIRDGDEAKTESSMVDIYIAIPTTKESATTEAETTTNKARITDSIEKTTEKSGNIITEGPIGGEKSSNVEARVDKKFSRVLPIELIVAVVVGTVCVVIPIVFVAYRIRKRNEGSYVLSNAGYKDTLQGDTGKEVFV